MHGHPVDAMRFTEALIVPLDPGLHLGVLVGRVVVSDQVQSNVVRGLPVELPEEVQPLPVGVPRRGAGEYPAVEVGQRREQRDGAVAFVVVGLRAAVAAHNRKAGLGALQGLALALLVAAEHQGAVRRFQVQTDHVPELLLELLVVGQLERPRHVGLDVVGTPQPLDGRRRHPRRGRHAAHRPAPAVRRRPCRADDDLFAHLRGDDRLAPAPRGVRQPSQPRRAEAALPLDDRRTADAQFPRRGRLAGAVCATEHDRRPQVIPPRGGRSPCQPLQRVALLWCKGQRRCRAWHDGQHTREQPVCQLYYETVH